LEPAGGQLSGKHRRDKAAPEDSRQLAGWKKPPIGDQERLWRIVDALVEIAEGRGVSAAQVALAWLIGWPGVTSVIIEALFGKGQSGTFGGSDRKVCPAGDAKGDAGKSTWPRTRRLSRNFNKMVSSYWRQDSEG
jgi:Aldo/keto reductase family